VPSGDSFELSICAIPTISPAFRKKKREHPSEALRTRARAPSHGVVSILRPGTASSTYRSQGILKSPHAVRDARMIVCTLAPWTAAAVRLCARPGKGHRQMTDHVRGYEEKGIQATNPLQHDVGLEVRALVG